MLLNKYERFCIISKDDFAEEMLYKIEKNFNNKKTLEDKAFPLLNQIVEVFTDTEVEDVKQRMKVADPSFAKLLTFAAKFDQLAIN